MGQCEEGGGDSEAASGMIADFLCKVPHMKLGNFGNGRTTGLGQFPTVTNDRYLEFEI